MIMKDNSKNIKCRSFIGRTDAVAAGLTILYGSVIGSFGHRIPSDKPKKYEDFKNQQENGKLRVFRDTPNKFKVTARACLFLAALVIAGNVIASDKGPVQVKQQKEPGKKEAILSGSQPSIRSIHCLTEAPSISWSRRSSPPSAKTSGSTR